MKMPHPTDPEHVLLHETELAQRHGLSIKTLQNQRVAGGGVPFLKLGRTVRYRLSDVLEFERQSLRHSTSQLPPRQ